jgi:hypothetical protein
LASDALGAAFGGLKQFLLNRRALNQDTENREFLAKQRDLALRGGEQGLQIGEANLTGLNFRNTRAPIEAGFQDLTSIKSLGGAESLDQEALTSVLGAQSPLVPGLARGLGRETARNATNDQILGSQATLQGNAAERSGISLGALQEARTSPGDPLNDQGVAQRNVIAGIGEANRPTYGREFADRQTLQDDSQAHATSLQGSAQAFSREMADRTIPLGVHPTIDHMAMTSINQYNKDVDQLRREISIIDQQIAENAGRSRQALLAAGPKGAAPHLDGAAAATAAFEKQKQEKLQAIYQMGDEIDRTLKGTLANNPEALSHYRGLINSIRMGAQSVPSAPSPTPTGGGGTIKVALP